MVVPAESAVDMSAAGIQYVNADGTPDDTASGIQSLTDILNSGVQAYQQVKLTDLNVQRLNNGLPALTAAQTSGVTGNIPDATMYGAPTNWTPWLIGGIILLILLVED